MSAVVPIHGEDDSQAAFAWELPKANECYDLDGKKLWTPMVLAPQLRVAGKFAGVVGKVAFNFFDKDDKHTAKWKILVDYCELEEV